MKQLMKYKKRVEKERLQADPEDYKDLDLVVCSQNGTPPNKSKSNLRRAFDHTIQKAGLKKIKFHGMRHTHATLLLLQGVNPKVVSERLGHSSVKISPRCVFSFITEYAERNSATAWQSLKLNLFHKI